MKLNEELISSYHAARFEARICDVVPARPQVASRPGCQMHPRTVENQELACCSRFSSRGWRLLIFHIWSVKTIYLRHTLFFWRALMTKKLVAFVMTLALISPAFGFTPQDASGIFLPEIAQETATAGSAYFVAPGIGSAAGGFAIAANSSVDSTIDGAVEVVGTTIGVDAAPISSGDTQAGTYSLTLDLTTTGDLAPAGFNVGGFAADTGGFFLGANGGGTPVAFDFPPIVTFATISVTDLAGAVSGPFDITGFGNFTAGPGGSWDGSAGVTFGAGSNGISGYQLVVQYVPEPASAGLLLLGSLLGLGVIRRS